MFKIKNVVLFALLISSLLKAESGTDIYVSDSHDGAKVVSSLECAKTDEKTAEVVKPKQIQVETIAYTISNCNKPVSFPVTVRTNSLSIKE